MRRLPVYFLIDISESMAGEPVRRVEEGLETIIKELRTDPYAVETVYISVIVFAGKAKKISPLVELYNFYPPKLPVGGGTSLGNALNFLMDDISSSVKKTTMEEKGDWKPIVFLFTDGAPTDNVDAAFERWNNKYRRAANLVAVSLGDNLDTRILGRITDHVLLLKDTDAASFNAFFKWITASVKTSSICIGEWDSDEFKLAPLNDDVLVKIDLDNLPVRPQIDENYAVVLAKCQVNERPYLIKYQKRLSPSQFSDFASHVIDYKLVGAYPIDNTYFELTDGYQTGKTVNTSGLSGFPACPCCGNQYGFSLCACGRIMCVGDENISKCPWCGMQARFGIAEGDSDVGRTRG